MNLPDIIRQLSANAEALNALLRTIPDEQARWSPDPDTWSLAKVMEHVYNEERIDFRKHLREMFHEPPLPFEPWSEKNYIEVTDLQDSLARFLAERQDSLAWLRSLQAPDWEIRVPAPWGEPISAGDVLVSWVEHDFLHLRQFNELLYAWHAAQAAPYSVRYAGDW